ncbi:hypothetical protein AB0I28_23210 [Phytomonospora sp. NPDC050363]|uniref:hypothetical protein n=1 Tax=Phytomonospora sp. NPDC050363 TaxID=3155642 RepID=UPI0033F9D470
MPLTARPTARLLATFRDIAPGARIEVDVPRALLTVVDDTHLAVHSLPDFIAGTGTPTLFPLPWPRRHTRAAVSPALDFAVFAGTHALRAVNTSGALRWELPHGCWSRCGTTHTTFDDYSTDLAHSHPDSGSALVSNDGRHVWAHLISPDISPEISPDGTEQWLVIDAADGRVLATAPTGTYAHGSAHFAVPDPTRVALGVGEGQDGVPLLWGAWDGIEPPVELPTDLPTTLHTTHVGDDRIITAISPSGEHYLTVAHDQSALTLHRTSDDTPVGELTPPALDAAGELPSWRYTATFLDEHTAIAASIDGDYDAGATSAATASGSPAPCGPRPRHLGPTCGTTTATATGSTPNSGSTRDCRPAWRYPAPATSPSSPTATPSARPATCSFTSTASTRSTTRYPSTRTSPPT